MNGPPGPVAQRAGAAVPVAAFAGFGGRVARVRAVRNPE